MNNKSFILLFLLAISIGSCKKYLEAKSDKSIDTPSSMADLEGLLENYSVLNNRYPAMGEVGTDIYYLTDANWGSTNEMNQQLYFWQAYDDVPGDWYATFNSVYYANTILEILPKVTDMSNQQQADYVKGAAHFIRGSYYLALAQLFTPPYDESTSQSDLGLPLRLNTNYNERSVRSSVEATYNLITQDLKTAIRLLPAVISSKYRASRPAAYAALARTYMAMRQYPLAGLYADSCLKLYDTLQDYNSVNASSSIPFSQFGPEIIYDARTNTPAAMVQSKARIDSLLYLSYETNDLRRSVFFKNNGNGSYAFKGSYLGINTSSLFAGYATDEMYLLRAECFAREGNKEKALADLNRLLLKRWKTGTFSLVNAGTAKEALEMILKERKKELLFRNLRWTDLRRLNKETDYAVTLKRILNGQTYILAPNSPRYVHKIDQEVILKSGMEQNP